MLPSSAGSGPTDPAAGHVGAMDAKDAAMVAATSAAVASSASPPVGWGPPTAAFAPAVIAARSGGPRGAGMAAATSAALGTSGSPVAATGVDAAALCPAASSSIGAGPPAACSVSKATDAGAAATAAIAGEAGGGVPTASPVGGCCCRRCRRCSCFSNPLQSWHTSALQPRQRHHWLPSRPGWPQMSQFRLHRSLRGW